MGLPSRRDAIKRLKAIGAKVIGLAALAGGAKTGKPRDHALAVASETGGWLYQHKRDLTGFVDGTENPSVIEAPEAAVLEEGSGAGSSVLLYQIWKHAGSWRALTVIIWANCRTRSKVAWRWTMGTRTSWWRR